MFADTGSKCLLIQRVSSKMFADTGGFVKNDCRYRGFHQKRLPIHGVSSKMFADTGSFIKMFADTGGFDKNVC